MVKKCMSITVIIFLVFATGCGSAIRIYSSPPSAKIYRNGVDTGLVTPAKIRVRKLGVGRHDITVKKTGFKTTPSGQRVDIAVSIGNIIWSWFPPILIKNLAGNLWKGIIYPRGGRLETFQLIKKEDQGFNRPSPSE